LPCSCPPRLLQRTHQRGHDEDVAAVAHAAVGTEHHAVAQLVAGQHLRAVVDWGQ
jgi:hypothetical protein